MTYFSTSGHISNTPLEDRATAALEKCFDRSSGAKQIQKAAFDSSNLAAGGLMVPAQSTTYVRLLRTQPTILRSVRMVRTKSPNQRIDRIGFGGRIFHTVAEDTAPGTEDKPTTSKVELATKEFTALIPITYEALEDSIGSMGKLHGSALANTIWRLAAKQGALDAEEFALFGDTASGDPDLAQFDGWIKVAEAANSYDHLDQNVSKELFKNSMLTLPKQYRANTNALRFYGANDVELEYADEIADRISIAGDRVLVDGFKVLSPYGIPMIPNGTIPTDLGAGNDESKLILTFPENLIFGIWRDMHLDFDKNIQKRRLEVVITMRIDAKIEQSEGAVVATNFKVA